MPQIQDDTAAADSINGEIAQLITADQLCMSSRFIGAWDCITEDENGQGFTALSLNGMEGNLVVYQQPGGDYVLRVSVYTTCLGLTEQGAVYYYDAYGAFSNGPSFTGVVALKVEDVYDSFGLESTLYVTELGGTPLLGQQVGETTALTRSYG